MKLWAILPELVLGGACLALVPLAGLLKGRWLGLVSWLALASVAAAGVLTARMLPWEPVAAFHGIYAVDGFAQVFKLVVLVGALVTLLLLRGYFRGHPQSAQAPVALLFATLGAVGLVSSLDLALIVLFLQMTSLAGYVLAVMVRGDRRAQEASIKYFLYGGVALAVMAYGLTFLYGLTGSLHLDVIGAALRGADRLWVVVAFVIILVGYGFEITMVPFHVWAPDVFSGATAPVSGFFSVVPKVAAFAALLRLLLHAMPGELAGWPWVIAGAAVVTMTFGNLAALRQTRLKRLLAYSSIAQAGYVLMGVAVASRVPGANAAVGYYLAAYVFMNLAAFAVAGQLERALGSDSFEALGGLGRRSPGAAVVLALSMLSLAGIPPLAGFAGKILLIGAAFEGGMTWLAVVAAVNWVVALYYYVVVIAKSWLDAPTWKHPVAPGPGFTAAHAINVAGMLVLGIVPGPVLEVMAVASVLL